MDRLVIKQTIFRRNDYLYKTNEPFKKIIMIRSGCVKTFKVNACGETIITGFCYPGELLGLNAIASETYQECALALDTLSVCQLSFSELEKIAQEFRCFDKQLIKLMSEKLSTHFMPNQCCSAESKIAFFLLNISKKMKMYGASGLHFNLSMTREDIGQYLGLATETVSRVLSKFQVNNILKCSNKYILLEDYFQLEHIASQAS